VVSESTVLRAKRDTLLVMIRSIFPARASATMFWKPSRCLAEVPLIPSSEYMPANSQSAREVM